MSVITVTPMVEVNWVDAPMRGVPGTPTYFEHAVEGLRIWQRVTDTAIVSTRPGNAELYTRLRDSVPGMRIIPGLKTKDLLDRLDSVNGWKAVVREVAAICDTSGERVVLIENEKAVYPFIRGEQSADMDQLRKALSFLPKDIEYLWYPSIFGTEKEQMRCAQLCCAVQEVLSSVRFLDQRFQGEQAVCDRWRIAADRRLMAIAQRPTLRMAYFYGPEYPITFWRDAQIHVALRYIRSGSPAHREAVIYPGVLRWPEAARELTKRLQSPWSLAGLALRLSDWMGTR